MRFAGAYRVIVSQFSVKECGHVWNHLVLVLRYWAPCAKRSTVYCHGDMAVIRILAVCERRRVTRQGYGQF
jgi:hypothetical protein